MTQLEKGSVDPAGVDDAAPRLGAERRRRLARRRTTPTAGTRWSRRTRRRPSRPVSGIPILYGVDAVHGHNNVVGATIFPHNVGLGAAQRPGARRADRPGDRARDGRDRHPLGLRAGRRRAAGRSLGPHLRGLRRGPARSSRSSARRSSRGLQGDDLTRADSAAATAKHFLGDGGTAWARRRRRATRSTRASPTSTTRPCRAIHLPPVRSRDRCRRPDRHGVVLEHGRRQGPRRPPPADRRPQGRARLHRLRRLRLGRRRPGRSGLRHGGRDAPSSAGIDMVMVPSDGRASRRRSRPGLAAGTIEQRRGSTTPSPASCGSSSSWASSSTRCRRRATRPAWDPPPIGRSRARPSPSRPCCSRRVRRAAARRPGDVSARRSGRRRHRHSSRAAGRSRGRARPGRSRPARPSPTRWPRGSATASRRSAPATFPAGTHAQTGIVVVAEPPYAEGKGDSATLALPAATSTIVAAVRPMVDRLVVVILSGRPVMLDAILPTPTRSSTPGCPAPRVPASPTSCSATSRSTARRRTPGRRRPDDAPRTGKAACDGAVFPRRLRPRRDGHAAAAGGLPRGLTAGVGTGPARRPHAPLMRVWAMVPA